MKRHMEKIKLVIWDLDETFWKGTLSEEGITPIPENIELVKELTNRGIINSIASKNSMKQAKEKLQELGIWELFVFPSINWNPKGRQVKEIIEDCQLRAPNVLFIDDNHMNLEEVRYYNPDIHTVSPQFISSIPTHPAFSGKNDLEHSRLKQYKILETKKIAKKKYADNVEFLKNSEITLCFIENLLPHAKRIHELIERTNQLNFTKIRLSYDEVVRLLQDDRYKQGALWVTDRFGDYGLVGYYCLDPKENHLIHFVFSCRIINLGIEQYVYAHLNFPKLKINGDVATPLKQENKPDWISVVPEKEKNHPVTSNSRQVRLLFKGGCDLSQMIYYLRGYNFKLLEETNYVGQNNFPIHNEHTQLLVQIHQMKHNDQFKRILDFCPFFDDSTMETKVFEADYDIFVYSLLMDFTQDLYLHKESGILIPFGGYREKLVNEDLHDRIIRKFAERGLGGMTAEFLSTFAREFEYIGPITADHLKENLTYIRRFIPQHIPMILMNGAEIVKPEFSEEGALERHQIMNAALKEIIPELPHTYLFDIRNVVNTAEKLTDNIRHYNRQTYNELAMELMKLLQDKLKIQASKNLFKQHVLKILKHPKLINNRVTRKFKR